MARPLSVGDGRKLLVEGTQKVVSDQPLVYGQSITDPCLGWEDTEQLIEILAQAVESRFK